MKSVSTCRSGGWDRFDATSGWFRLGLITLGLSLAIAIGFAATRATARGATISCGSTVTTNVKLTHDLLNCPKDGLVVGAKGITIDLNGHTISGTSSDGSGDPDQCFCGVNDTAGYDGVTLRSGRVKGFRDGARFTASDGVVVRDLISRAHWNNGVFIQQANRGLVEDSAFADSYRGVFSTDSQGLLVRDNTVTDTEHAGVALFRVKDTVVRNTAIGLSGGDYGVEVVNSSRNLVTNNRVAGGQLAPQGNDGIVVASLPEFGGLPSIANAIVGNDVRTGSIGIELIEVDGSTVRKTLVSANTVVGMNDNGILVDAVTSQDGSGFPPFDYLVGVGPDQSLISGNLTNRNALDGIHLDAPGNAIGHNVADRNAGFGISAFPGNSDLGGNRAHGNGASSQCSGVTCS